MRCRLHWSKCSSSNAPIEQNKLILSFQADKNKQEALVKKMHFEQAKNKLMNEREVEEQVRLLRNERERVIDLEHQLMRWQRHNANEEEYEQLRAKPEEPTASDPFFPSEAEKLIEDNIRLRDDLYEEKRRASDTEAEMREELSSLRSRNEELEEQLANARSAAAVEGSSETVSCSTELAEAKGKLEVAQREVKRLESVVQAVEEDRLQQRLMREKLNSYARNERELRRVQEENQLLKEVLDQFYIGIFKTLACHGSMYFLDGGQCEALEGTK